MCFTAVTSDKLPEVAVASPQRVRICLVGKHVKIRSHFIRSLTPNHHSISIEQPPHSPIMPKQLSRKRAASEDYEADGGFVEDAPKSKKTKASNVKATTSNSNAKSQDSESEYWEVRKPRSLLYKVKNLI